MIVVMLLVEMVVCNMVDGGNSSYSGGRVGNVHLVFVILLLVVVMVKVVCKKRDSDNGGWSSAYGWVLVDGSDNSYYGGVYNG